MPDTLTPQASDAATFPRLISLFLRAVGVSIIAAIVFAALYVFIQALE